jgi:hypothetical protein
MIPKKPCTNTHLNIQPFESILLIPHQYTHQPCLCRIWDTLETQHAHRTSSMEHIYSLPIPTIGQSRFSRKPIILGCSSTTGKFPPPFLLLTFRDIGNGRMRRFLNHKVDYILDITRLQLFQGPIGITRCQTDGLLKEGTSPAMLEGWINGTP